MQQVAVVRRCHGSPHRTVHGEGSPMCHGMSWDHHGGRSRHKDASGVCRERARPMHRLDACYQLEKLRWRDADVSADFFHSSTACRAARAGFWRERIGKPSPIRLRRLSPGWSPAGNREEFIFRGRSAEIEQRAGFATTHQCREPLRRNLLVNIAAL